MSTKSLTRVVHAAENVRRAEDRLRRARLQLHDEIVAAHDGGVTLAAISRALGVTRQRVAQIVREEGSGRGRRVVAKR